MSFIILPVSFFNPSRNGDSRQPQRGAVDADDEGELHLVPGRPERHSGLR